jgi:hypothetical protein
MTTVQDAANQLAALLRQSQPTFKATATTLEITQGRTVSTVNLQQRQTGGRSVQGR